MLINDGTRQLYCLIENDTIVFIATVGHDCVVDNLMKVIQSERKFGILKDIDPSTLELWKVNIDLEPYDEDSLHHLKLNPNDEGVERLTPWNSVGEYWPDQPPMKHIHIIVRAPTVISFRKHLHSSPAEDNDDREAKRTQDDMTYCINGIMPHLRRDPDRKWNVDGAISDTDIKGCYYVDPGIQDESQRCLKALLEHQFVLLAGARASGKTTRLFWLKRELGAKGYKAIYFSFKRANCNNLEAFWNTFGRAIQIAASRGPFAISQNLTILSSRENFLSFFHANAWKRKVVLIIDDICELYRASSIIQVECLRAFREIRNHQRPYAIHGLIAAGSCGILHLAPMFTTSPFNVADHVLNPHFNIDETRKLFLEFAQDHLITIDDAIIEDVWFESNGHPGMVCLCGRAISQNLLRKIPVPDCILSYKPWKTFSAIHLHDKFYEDVIFRTMITSLLREESTLAVNLLRSHFVGFLDTVSLQDPQQVQQANFLVAEGVLLQSAPHDYHMASAFVDGFIRRYLIPEKFPNAPSTLPPMASDGRPNVLEVLTQSLKYFDKDLIRLAAARSYKESKVHVGGLRAVHVPRESVYDTELLRILTNWLGKQEEYTINSQWHLRTDQNKNKYCNIVISKPTTPTVVLELLATGDVSFVRARIEKISYYKDLLSADEAWVVHFTREDDYLDHPTWQFDEQLQSEGVNVVHFWHDQGFSTMSMSARWKDADGNIQEVNNQPVAL